MKNNAEPLLSPFSSELGNYLRQSARSGDLATASRLLDAGAPPNGAVFFEGWSHLSEIEDRDLRAAKAMELSVSGAYETPLEIAASLSNEGMVRLLLSNGARGNRLNPEGAGALHFSAIAGSLACAQALLEAGAQPNAESLWGLTPLQAAAQCDDPQASVEIIRALVKGGAKVNQINRLGESAAHSCVFNRNEAGFEALLALGADPTIKTESGFDCKSALESYEPDHPDRALFDRMLGALAARELVFAAKGSLSLGIKARRARQSPALAPEPARSARSDSVTGERKGRRCAAPKGAG